MSRDVALTPDEIAALAGASAPRWYMVFDTMSGNIVATAQVNAPGGDPYALNTVSTISVDNTSAGWSNVAPDMVIFIGSTPGAYNKGIYRVRREGTTFAFLGIMANGTNDSGSINIALRPDAIQDNDYITILDRFDIFGVYPHIAYTGIGTDANIYEDWNLSYTGFNEFPPPIINITIDGQPSNFARHVYGDTAYTFDITFDVTLWPTSSSVSWVTTLPAGWTLNSGTLTGSGTSNTINVTVPHSADAYTLRFTATEDHGSVFTSYRKVWIKSNTCPPISIVRFDSDTDDITGGRRTVTFNQLYDVPPGAMIHLFDMGNWNGVDVPSAIKCFSGYVQRRREVTEIGTSGVSLDLVGPSYMMAQIGSQSQIFSAVAATPATWQEVIYTLSYLDFIIWWIIASRASGLLQMFNYTPFGLANTSHRMTDWRIDSGTLLAQVQAQAARYGGGNFGCDPSGEMQLQRNLSRIPWSDRGDVPTRCTLDASIYSQVETDFEAHPRLRRLRGEAFISDGLTFNTPVWCDAPPFAGQGDSEEKLERMIVDDTDEIYGVTGDEYQARNSPYPANSLTINKNYAVIKPAQMLPFELDIADWLRYDGVAYTALSIPTQVTRTHNPDGTIDTQISFETETVGVPATDVPIPVPDPTVYSSPYNFTPFSPVPPWISSNPNPAGTPSGGATSTPKDGSVDFGSAGNRAFLVRNFIGTPQYSDVTPPDLGSFLIKHGAIQSNGSQAWLLASDGSVSAVWYTPNVFIKPLPAWVKGDEEVGVWEKVCPTDTPGLIALYSSNATAAGGWSITLNWLTTDYHSTYATTTATQGGATPNYSAGNGYGGLGVYLVYVNVSLVGDSTTYITNAGVTLSLDNPSGSGSFELQAGGSSQNNNPATSGTYVFDAAYSDGPFIIPAALPVFRGNFNGPDYPGNAYAVRMREMRMSGVGTMPTLS